MKAPSLPLIAGVMLAVAGAGVATLTWLNVSERFREPALVFDAIHVENGRVLAGNELTVAAEVTLGEANAKCTNGMQMYARSGDGSELRMSGVDKKSEPGGRNEYTATIPEDLEPGLYAVRVRESFSCGAQPEIVNSPWLRFEVVSPEG